MVDKYELSRFKGFGDSGSELSPLELAEPPSRSAVLTLVQTAGLAGPRTAMELGKNVNSNFPPKR